MSNYCDYRKKITNLRPNLSKKVMSHGTGHPNEPEESLSIILATVQDGEDINASLHKLASIIQDHSVRNELIETELVQDLFTVREALDSLLKLISYTAKIGLAKNPDDAPPPIYT